MRQRRKTWLLFQVHSVPPQGEAGLVSRRAVEAVWTQNRAHTLRLHTAWRRCEYFSEFKNGNPAGTEVEVDAATAKGHPGDDEDFITETSSRQGIAAASVDGGSLEQALAMEDRNQVLCVRAGYIKARARAFLEKRGPRHAERA